MKDFTGQTFNGLTALRLGTKISGKYNRWVWKCVCGNEVEYRSCVVAKGHVKSCGCREHHALDEPSPCVVCGEPSDRKTAKGKPAARCQKCYNRGKNHTERPVDYLYYRAKDRANTLNLPFTITKDDIVIPEFCPVLGLKMSFSGMKERSTSPSLDKIIPELGYVPGNIAIISHRANLLKNNGTFEERTAV